MKCLSSDKHFLFTGKTIFVSALDWGLGHATRCVPLINSLKNNNKIILGVTPLTSVIFDEEFPDLEKITVPSYNIRYSRIFPVGVKLLLDSPKILSVMKAEKAQLRKIIVEKKIDIVISDSRFGMYSPHTKNIFITHQTFLKTPFANLIAQKINKNFLLKFDELWIPDYGSENNLSGELSHGKHFHPHVKYINPLSRLNKSVVVKQFDYLCLLSGPEPHHSLLRGQLLMIAEKFPSRKFAMVTNVKDLTTPENVSMFYSPSKNVIANLISASEKIICRSGYSTLMDLHEMGKENSILIPTPGQTEQEYLAAYWKKKYDCDVLSDNSILTYSF